VYTTDPEQPAHPRDQSELPAAIPSEPDDRPTVVAADTSLAPLPTKPESEGVSLAYAPRPAPWPAAPTRAASRSSSPRVLLGTVGVLIVLALVGLGAVKLRGALTPPPAPTRVAIHPTATAHVTATAVPTMPNFTVPNGKIGFGAGGATNSSQTCAATAALPALTIYLYNSGNVPVDWWIEVKQTLPDGKTLWTGTNPPYGTLPVGQGGQLQLQPDASLCGELIGHPGAVQYTATVFYGGTGGFTITDTITPPRGTSTRSPTGPPTIP
jgi:hypothetical protein